MTSLAIFLCVILCCAVCTHFAAVAVHGEAEAVRQEPHLFNVGCVSVMAIQQQHKKPSLSLDPQM